MRIRAEMVKLQREMASVHATDSERRLAEDQAKAVASPGRRRRG